MDFLHEQEGMVLVDGGGLPLGVRLENCISGRSYACGSYARRDSDYHEYPEFPL
jgi:hypothetical protein